MGWTIKLDAIRTLRNGAASPRPGRPRDLADFRDLWVRIDGIRMVARAYRACGPSCGDIVLVPGLVVSSLYLLPTAR